jgi:hypothetical protein
MSIWQEDGRTIQEARHDWYDDDISDELFDYWEWVEQDEAWEAYKENRRRGAEDVVT